MKPSLSTKLAYGRDALEEIPHPGAWTEKGGASTPLAKGVRLTIAPWSTRLFTRRF